MDPNSDTPQETILLAVTGMSPAVLTETLWALAHEAEPVIPNRVIAITTLVGRDRIATDLFTCVDGAPCVWDALRAQLVAAGHDLTGKLRFGTTPDDLRVITAVDPATGRSRELSDLRDRAENEAAADFLLDQIRSIVANPDTRIIASIAGGRKTMGALLFACMTLAGREDDRITHVLVNEPYETLPRFFFPGQPGPPLVDRNGHAVDGPAPLIELADVPFVPLRNLFHRELGREAGTFSGLVASCRSDIRQRAAEDLCLELFNHRPALRLNQMEVSLTEREQQLLLCLARRAKQNCPAIASYKEALAALDEQREQNIEQGLSSTATARFTDDHDITRTLSDLRRKLKSRGAIGQILADALPTRGRFSLEVPGPLIYIQ